MNEGTIVQCIGAVVDVEFPRDGSPKIYDALKLDEIGLHTASKCSSSWATAWCAPSRSAAPTACAAACR